MRMAPVDVFFVRKIVSARLFGDRCFQATLYKVPCKIVGTIPKARAEQRPGFRESDDGKRLQLLSIHKRVF